MDGDEIIFERKRVVGGCGKGSECDDGSNDAVLKKTTYSKPRITEMETVKFMLMKCNRSLM